MTNFISRQGQSIYDVCMNTYGTLDLLIKLTTDNGLNGIEDVFPIGKVFIFDDTKIANTQTYKNLVSNSVIFATKYTGQNAQTDIYVLGEGNTLLSDGNGTLLSA